MRTGFDLDMPLDRHTPMDSAIKTPDAAIQTCDDAKESTRNEDESCLVDQHTEAKIYRICWAAQDCYRTDTRDI